MSHNPIYIKYIGDKLGMSHANIGFTINKVYLVDKVDFELKRYYFFDNNNDYRFRNFESGSVKLIKEIAIDLMFDFLDGKV